MRSKVQKLQPIAVLNILAAIVHIFLRKLPPKSTAWGVILLNVKREGYSLIRGRWILREKGLGENSGIF